MLPYTRDFNMGIHSKGPTGLQYWNLRCEYSAMTWNGPSAPLCGMVDVCDGYLAAEASACDRWPYRINKCFLETLFQYISL